MTERDNIGMDTQEVADYEAVMRHVAEGTPVESELARRVHDWAARIMDEIRREHGDVDAVQLLRDAPEDP